MTNQPIEFLGHPLAYWEELNYAAIMHGYDTLIERNVILKAQAEGLRQCLSDTCPNCGYPQDRAQTTIAALRDDITLLEKALWDAINRKAGWDLAARAMVEPINRMQSREFRKRKAVGEPEHDEQFKTWLKNVRNQPKGGG